MKSAEYKIPGGKLLAAELDVEDDTLVHVKISGDFFMHPEQAIYDLESVLNSRHVGAISETVHRFFNENEVTLFGVSPGDFVTVLELCLSS